MYVRAEQLIAIASDKRITENAHFNISVDLTWQLTTKGEHTLWILLKQN